MSSASAMSGRYHLLCLADVTAHVLGADITSRKSG
jgi:hypothetical protein